MFFDCIQNHKNKTQNWKGEIKKFINYGSHYEIFVESRSSISLLFGKTSRGGFACIPDFEAGCHIVDLNNLVWNTEKLVSSLGKVDGITAANALYKLSKEGICI
jgi:hypothetical protein